MIKILCFSFFLFTQSYVFAAQKITVFAAASLSNVMEDINNAYQVYDPRKKVIFSYASSSLLARQIEYGAPADIFISADKEWMDYIAERRSIVWGPEILLKNNLVLITPNESSLTPKKITNSTNWDSLLPKGEWLVIGDPLHVPAGKYAKQSLVSLGVYGQLKNQFAYANNVRAALQLVERGEALLGIVYATDAKISSKVKVISYLPKNSFKPIEYPVALLNASAKSFYEFLKTNEAQAIFKKHGFIVL